MAHSLNLLQVLDRDGGGRKPEVIAKAAGISKAHIYQLLSGEVERPKPWILINLARELHRPYAYVFQAAQRSRAQCLEAKDPSQHVDRQKAAQPAVAKAKREQFPTRGIMPQDTTHTP